MRGRYGVKWTTGIGEEPALFERSMQEWGEVLAGLSGEEIKAGFEYCDEEWPPNAITFRKYCEATSRKGSQRFFDAEAYAASLPTVNKDLAREAIANIRKRL